MKNLTIGADPEFSIRDSEGNAIGAPTAMRHPNQLEVIKVKTRFGEIFPDNANLEASINYATTRKGFRANVKGVISVASKMLAEQGYTLHAISSLNYPKKELQHPLCKRFGCDPDYNSFTVSMNEISTDAVKRSFRTCGGHIHIGSSDEKDFLHDFQGKLDTVNTFELIAGIPSLFLDNNDASIKRRSLYGGAGAHRPKEYGVECRSLSNFWTKTPNLTDFVYTATEAVCMEMREKNLKTIDLMKLPDIINSGNLKKAEPLRSEIFEQYESVEEAFNYALEDSRIDVNVPLANNWNI